MIRRYVYGNVIETEARNGADRFTERAYQDVLNMYNTKAMAKQYSEKYDKAINTPGGGTA